MLTTIDMCNDLLATGEPATRLAVLYKNIELQLFKMSAGNSHCTERGEFLYKHPAGLHPHRLLLLPKVRRL